MSGQSGHGSRREEQSSPHPLVCILVVAQKLLEKRLVHAYLPIGTTRGNHRRVYKITPVLHLEMNQADKGVGEDLIVGQVFDQDQAFDLAGGTTAGDTSSAAGTKGVDTAQGFQDQNLGRAEISDPLQRWHLVCLK